MFPVSLLPEAERIRDAVKQETGLDSSIGIGTNRMIAKLASDQAKPRGLMEIRAGWEEGFPGRTPASRVARCRTQDGRALGWPGSHRSPPDPGMELENLQRILGDGARELKLRAHGHGSSRLSADRLPRSVSRETTLSRDATDKGRLDALLALFVSRVAGQLREEGLAARTVVLKLRHGDFYTVTRRHTLDEPTFSGQGDSGCGPGIVRSRV
jgi:DNA polymerase-4